MQGILSLHTERESVNSHQLRLALALKGGVIESHKLAPQTVENIRTRYKRSKGMVLADAETVIHDPLNALLYIDDIGKQPQYGGSRLFPHQPAAAALTRRSVSALTGSDAEGLLSLPPSIALGFWDGAGSALLRGGGNLCDGVTGIRLADSAFDAVFFPILHRCIYLFRSGRVQRPANTGTAAVMRYMATRYKLPKYSDSMTNRERLDDFR